ncbi:minor capsid protein [Wohlfahrtiimonas populi]|uniref:minor capsid protein n=1 Tax=Wohlfahrtiimonas populi TaxID=1940240 RepID=UPI00098CF74D|nr:minor capsid protein [Wohlfahrtiimonas populi]
MTTISYNDLTVALCEYKINIFRYDAYVRSIVFKHLDNTQKDLIARIISDDIANITKRDLDLLVRDIKGIITDEYERIIAYLNDTNQQFYVASHKIEANIYNSWLGYKAFSSMPNYKLESIKYAPLFDGRDIRDWWEKQLSDLQFKIETIIRNGNVIGDSQYNISKDIRNQIRISKVHADTLVRTANAAIANDAQEKLIEYNSDLVEAKQHLSTLDSRTTDVCKARDLKKWTLDNKPIGHKMQYRKPPLHYRCRSIIRMILKNSVASTRSSQFGQVNDNVDYSNWLKSQPINYQDRVLGIQRAKWFREGKLMIEQMLDQSDRPLTLKQLQGIYDL